MALRGDILRVRCVVNPRSDTIGARGGTARLCARASDTEWVRRRSTVGWVRRILLLGSISY